MDIFGRYEHYPDPITLGVVGVGLAAGGMTYQGISAQAEGKAENKMAKYNAKLDELKATEIEKSTAIKQQRQSEEANRHLASIDAAMGASGVVSTVGSPLLIQAKQASESDLENAMMGYNGSIQADEARSQATMDRMQGKMAQRAGTSQMYGSFMSAGGTALMGFAKYGGGSAGGGVTGQAIGGADASYVASPEFESLSGSYGTFM